MRSYFYNVKKVGFSFVGIFLSALEEIILYSNLESNPIFEKFQKVPKIPFLSSLFEMCPIKT